jgi:hypothetical protein
MRLQSELLDTLAASRESLRPWAQLAGSYVRLTESSAPVVQQMVDRP